MDYKKIYNALIDRAKDRILDGYKEKHHIVPRCMGGSNEIENLVELTPEEHFIAHQLLVKIYPEIDKLAFALAVMSGKNNNKAFGWHRRKIAEAQRKAKTGRKLGPMSEDHKKAIGDANRGENNGMYGKKLTDEHKAKLKGRVPWNKGKKGLQEAWNKGTIGICKATEGSFTKGHVPWNKRKENNEHEHQGTSAGDLQSASSSGSN